MMRHGGTNPSCRYALIEASFELLGVSAAAARLPSALEGAALIAIVGVLVARLTTVRAGTLCAVAVATTLGVSIYSRVAHPEIAVVLSIVTSELLLAHWLTASTRRHRRIVALLIGASVGYGLLREGTGGSRPSRPRRYSRSLPFITMPKGVAAAAIGDAAFAGTIAIAIAAPWYVAMSFRHGWPFLENALWRQNVARYSTPTYGHHASVFFLILPALIALFPWVAALPAALGRIRATANGNRDVLRTVMLASAVTALVFYSLSTSKLAGYVLVCIPSLAVVVGLMLDDDFDDATAIARTVVGPDATGHLRRSPCCCASRGEPRPDNPQTPGRHPPIDDGCGRPHRSGDDLLGLFLVVGALFVVLARSSTWRVVAISVVGALVPVVVLVSARPLLLDMYPWETFGRTIAARPAPVWLLGRRAPSLTFYSHHAVSLVPTVESLEAGLASQATAWVAFTREDWTRLSPAGILAGKHGTVVAEGGRMVLRLFQRNSDFLPALTGRSAHVRRVEPVSRTSTTTVLVRERESCADGEHQASRDGSTAAAIM